MSAGPYQGQWFAWAAVARTRFLHSVVHKEVIFGSSGQMTRCPFRTVLLVGAGISYPPREIRFPPVGAC